MAGSAFWPDSPKKVPTSATEILVEQARLDVEIERLTATKSDLHDRTTALQAVADLINQMPSLSPRSLPRVRDKIDVDEELQPHLRTAELFWVTQPMKELVDAAVEDVPPMILHPSMAPALDGVLLTTESVGDFDLLWKAMRGQLTLDLDLDPKKAQDLAFLKWILNSERSPSFQGFWWHWGEAELRLGYLVHLNSVMDVMLTGTDSFTGDTEHLKNIAAQLTRAYDLIGPMMPITEMTLPLDSARWDPTLGPLTRWIVTCWLLMTQGGLSESSPYVYAPKEQRKATKDRRVLPDIRLITLRKGTTSASQSESGRKLSYRFAVRGHWRNQAWGPQRSLRRPVYVAPFLKGPDGAPLLEGTKVHVWRS